MRRHLLAAVCLACLGAACDFSAAGTTILEDSGLTTAGTSGTSTGTTSPGTSTGTSTSTTDPLLVDDDGDGYAESEGDCDDARPDVAPGLTDGCDGVDADCDGAVDEGAADDWEPNDRAAPLELGVLPYEASFEVVGNLHTDTDVDAFDFWTEDGWLDTFEIEVILENVPSGSVYRITLERLTPAFAELGSDYGGGQLGVLWPGDSFGDDTGDYRVVVEASSGAACDHDYLLTVRRNSAF